MQTQWEAQGSKKTGVKTCMLCSLPYSLAITVISTSRLFFRAADFHSLSDVQQTCIFSSLILLLIMQHYDTFFLLARKSHRIGCQVKFSGDESRWGAELLQVTLGYIFVQFLTDNIRRKAILLKSSSLNPPCRVLIKSKNKASSRKIGLFFVNGFSSHRGVDKMQGFQWNHARCLDLQLAPTAYPSSFPPTLGAFLLHCADTNPYPKSPSCSSSIPGERLRGAVGEVTGSIPMLLLFYTCNGERTHGLLKCSTENLSNALPEGSCKVSLYLGD